MDPKCQFKCKKRMEEKKNTFKGLEILDLNPDIDEKINLKISNSTINIGIVDKKSNVCVSTFGHII